VALLDLRQRSGHLFLAVMLGHILLISAQVNSTAGVPVLEAVTFGVLSELQRAAASAVSGAVHVWSGYIGLRHLKDENDALKHELASAQVAAQEQRALAGRTLGLQRLLDLRNSLDLRTQAAEIIGGAAHPDFRTVTVDKGTSSGLRADMAVLAPAGVVGRVVAPGLRAARVQLLIDRNAAAGAIVERTRAQGIVVGASDDRLHMEYVSEVFDVLVGDIVVTSGIDGIYPKGFVIGRVETVEKSGGAYRRIVVKPAVDFSGLEEVLVVTSPAQARDAPEGASE
jgi:rod shape-determining protein MreC